MLSKFLARCRQARSRRETRRPGSARNDRPPKWPVLSGQNCMARSSAASWPGPVAAPHGGQNCPARPLPACRESCGSEYPRLINRLPWNRVRFLQSPPVEAQASGRICPPGPLTWKRTKMSAHNIWTGTQDVPATTRPAWYDGPIQRDPGALRAISTAPEGRRAARRPEHPQDVDAAPGRSGNDSSGLVVRGLTGMSSRALAGGAREHHVTLSGRSRDLAAHFPPWCDGRPPRLEGTSPCLGRVPRSSSGFAPGPETRRGLFLTPAFVTLPDFDSPHAGVMIAGVVPA